MPEITFTIPFYSGLPYLKRAVQSVLDQTCPDWQLVVVDDAGPDGAAVEAYVAFLADPRITCIHNQKNLGLAGNWNRCLDLADTDVVNILHADDLLHPHYAELMLDAAKRWPEAALLFCRADIIDESGRPVFVMADWYKTRLLPSRRREYLLTGEAGVKALAAGDFVIFPTILYRKSALDGRRFDPHWRMVLDLDFLVQSLFAGCRIVGMNETAYSVRRHAASQTSVLTANLVRFEEESELLNRISAEAQQRGWIAAARTARLKTVVRLNAGYCIMADLLHGRVRAAWQKARFLVMK